MRLKCYLLVLTVAYVAIVVCGFLISIPMGVTKSNFGGYCALFMDINWENQNHFIAEFGDGTSCDFAIYLPVCSCVFYPLLMLIYHGYLLLNSSTLIKDDATTNSVWAIPCLLVNILMTVFMFILSCVVSTGVSHTCSQLLSGGNPQYEGCSDFQENMEWTNPVGDKIDTTTFYRNILLAQVCAWIGTGLWVAIVLGSSARLARGRSRSLRCSRRGEMMSISTSSSQEKTNIADVSPTA